MFIIEVYRINMKALQNYINEGMFDVEDEMTPDLTFKDPDFNKAVSDEFGLEYMELLPAYNLILKAMDELVGKKGTVAAGMWRGLEAAASSARAKVELLGGWMTVLGKQAKQLHEIDDAMFAIPHKEPPYVLILTKHQEKIARINISYFGADIKDIKKAVKKIKSSKIAKITQDDEEVFISIDL